ncbi:hypothetical protein FA95DRAFT_1559090 [Auriscalpium vulgare]|uniref:Uncharacterized protein n=1 Tax=Auriscalpium vulgare TaxID=40419 RepID=A0ACB8RUL9_9AGAM|nr:hypothetical protein FA95DRAFT_1559090 [Auriscalpium vulgare]
MQADNSQDAQVRVEATQPSLHPMFSFDADVVLGSRDGVLFRVPSTTLKMTSSWFRTLFTLPQSTIPSTPTTPTPSPLSDTINLDEDARTLEHLLRMICGLTIPELDSWDTVEPLLYAAEKYDMPGPQSIVRALVRTPPFLDTPLRLYAAACRYGWAAEARLASTRTLTLDLRDRVHRSALLKLKTDDLLALQDLHHRRREDFRQRLSEPPFLTDMQLTEAYARCARCHEPVDYAAWRELKYVMVLEMDRRPAGDMIPAGLEEWPAARACWAAKCKKMSCGSSVYDRTSSTRAIQEAIIALPETIEESTDSAMA